MRRPPHFPATQLPRTGSAPPRPRRAAGCARSGPLRRLRKSEDGNSTIEFVILFPLIMLMFFNAFESGLLMVRHVMLERGLDVSVRAIRLGTANEVEASDVKYMVCNAAGLIPDCLNTVKVEMVRVDPRAWSELPRKADCVDKNHPAAPSRQFVPGGSNDLMVLRVCALFTPLFPLAGLGFQMHKEDGARYALVSTSAFVMEPG